VYMQRGGRETDSFFPFYLKKFFPMGIDCHPPFFLHGAWGIEHRVGRDGLILPTLPKYL